MVGLLGLLYFALLTCFALFGLLYFALLVWIRQYRQGFDLVGFTGAGLAGAN